MAELLNVVRRQNTDTSVLSWLQRACTSNKATLFRRICETPPAHVRCGVDDRKSVVGSVEEADTGGNKLQSLEDELERRYECQLQLFTIPGASETNPGGAHSASSSIAATSPEAGTCGTDALGVVVRTRGRSCGSPSCPRHLSKCADPVGLVLNSGSGRVLSGPCQGSKSNISDPLDNRNNIRHQYDYEEQQGPIKKQPVFWK